MLQVLIFLSRECRTCTIFTRFVFLPKKQQPPPPMRLHPRKKIKRNQIKTNQSNSHGQHKQRDQ